MFVFFRELKFQYFYGVFILLLDFDFLPSPSHIPDITGHLQLPRLSSATGSPAYQSIRFPLLLWLGF